MRVSAGTPFAPDIAVASTEELAAQLAQIEGNPFAPVVFTGLRIDAQVAREFRALQVEGMEREEGGDWVPVAEDAPLQVRAGAVLRLRVRLSSFRGTAGSPAVELALTVPALAPGAVGRLVVRGAGQADGGEEPLPPAEPEGASFTDLLDALRDAPRNDELVAELRFAEDADPSGEPASAARSRLGDVVTGAAGALVEVVE